MKYLTHQNSIGYRKCVSDILGYVEILGPSRQATDDPGSRSTVEAGGLRTSPPGIPEKFQGFIEVGTFEKRFPGRSYEHAGKFFKDPRAKIRHTEMSFPQISVTTERIEERTEASMNELEYELQKVHSVPRASLDEA